VEYLEGSDPSALHSMRAGGADGSVVDTVDHHDGGAHDDLGVHVFSKDPLAPALTGLKMPSTSG
jgi:hypothetical protein